MIPKVNLGVGEMGFMFKYPLAGKNIFDKFSLFDFCFASRHIRFSEFYILKSASFDFHVKM